MAAKRQRYQGGLDFYSKKLDRVMERFGASDVNFMVGRSEAWIEFRIDGQLYRFDHTIERANQAGQNLKTSTELFAQLVYALEDLARLTERGIYTLKTWLSGLKALPTVTSAPTFLQFMGFDETPPSIEDVRARYKTLALQLHPDQGGSGDDWHKLQTCMEQATRFMASR